MGYMIKESWRLHLQDDSLAAKIRCKKKKKIRCIQIIFFFFFKEKRCSQQGDGLGGDPKELFQAEGLVLAKIQRLQTEDMFRN